MLGALEISKAAYRPVVLDRVVGLILVQRHPVGVVIVALDHAQLPHLTYSGDGT